MSSQSRSGSECSYECGICLESYDASSNISRMPCGHTGCFTCIAKVIRGVNTTCPYCRADLIEPENSGEEDDDSEDFNDSDDDSVYNEPETYSIERLCDAFEQKGYTLKDALKLIFGRYTADEMEDLAKLQRDLDEMDEQLQEEYDNEHPESDGEEEPVPNQISEPVQDAPSEE